MARRMRESSRGERLPQLEAGLRAHAERFGPVRRSVLDRLEEGDPFVIDGLSVWMGLVQVDGAAAEAFRRRCGWEPGMPGAWLSVEESCWTYDPRSAVLAAADFESEK